MCLVRQTLYTLVIKKVLGIIFGTTLEAWLDFITMKDNYLSYQDYKSSKNMKQKIYLHCHDNRARFIKSANVIWGIHMKITLGEFFNSNFFEIHLT